MTTPFVLDFDDIFNKHIASNQKTWAHDRSQTIGASEAFKCIRALAFDKRGKEFGAEPDEDEVDWGAMERGNIIENHFVVPALEHLPDDITLEFGGTEQRTLILGRNSATPDGLFTGIPKGPVTIKAGGHTIVIDNVTAGCIGLEIKSIDPRVTLEEEKKVHYGQTQIGLGLMRETTEWAPDHWLILYIDASFLSKQTPFLVTYEPGVFKSAQMIAKAIYEREKIEDFEPEGKFTGECDHCTWTTACGESVLSQWAQLEADGRDKDPALVEAVSPGVEAYFAAKAAAEESAEAFERVKQDVKNMLLDLKSKKVSGADWTLTWFTVKGKKSYDYKQLVEDHGIDTAPYEKVGQGFDQLRVTPKGKKD